MKILIATCLAGISTAMLLSNPAAASDDLSWSQKQLFDPSPSLLLAESRGRVTIYDGLHDTEIDDALDQQFHRVQSMMFVGTRHTAPDGIEVADDDCD